MPSTCPSCHHTLPTADEPVRFCPFCGRRLDDATRPGDVQPATTPDAAPADSELAPAQVGGYRIGRALGSGGMGHVYEAEPVAGGPPVALKLLSRRLRANPVSVERFRQEGRLAAQIAHPRCVFVLAADTENGRPYIVMELMPGDTLKDLADRRGPLPPAEAIRLILDVIDGLREAHRLGVIHRDVKPSNCFLLPDGRVKVGDFGLSKSLASTAQLTGSGAFLGTVLYASPEQIKGEPVDYASDVYSVCATLYHLLAGRPPFFHESPTAALSKIISEDPPDVRAVNPAVPPDVARVVRRGLERDPDRRYATLAELRAALAALVPEQLTFGGMGVRVAASLLDEVIVRVGFVLPARAAIRSAVGWDWAALAAPLVLFPLYFVLLEGLTGASWGKRLFGLRVCRQGTTLPPGFRRAAIRTLVFYLLVTVTLSQAVLVAGKLGAGESWPQVLVNLVPFLIGLAVLVIPMRRSNDFRGLHEKLSGTCVLRLPQVPRPLKLVGRHGDRMAALPARPADFPAVVGPYAVARAVRAADGWVAVGDDPVLGRRVLLRLRPDGGARDRHPTPGRPGRLWALGHGTVPVADVPHRWDAYVGPTGAPLADVVDRRHPVRWPEARPVLEPLAGDLAAADKDGTLPAQLSLAQVWVQPDGRPELLDFPLEPGATSTTAVGLLRQAAATLLEGEPRAPSDTGPVRAPVPRHAGRLLARLFAGTVPSPTEVASELAATRGRPARVTRGARAVQLAVQAGTLAAGLAVMFAASGLYSAFLALGSPEYLERARRLRSAERALGDTPEGLARIRAEPAFVDAVGQDPTFRERLSDAIARERAALRDALPGLNPAEEVVLDRMAGANRAAEPPFRDAIEMSHHAEGTPPPVIDRHWVRTCLAILVWPFLWAIAAFLLRGGLSNLLTGALLVRATGGRPGRRQCAARTLLVWLPVALLLCASVVVRAEAPDAATAYRGLWWAAAMLVPTYVAVALINPERGPHDRLLGLWLVPR
jgi:hypothetical protein